MKNRLLCCTIAALLPATAQASGWYAEAMAMDLGGTRRVRLGIGLRASF